MGKWNRGNYSCVGGCSAQRGPREQRQREEEKRAKKEGNKVRGVERRGKVVQSVGGKTREQ